MFTIYNGSAIIYYQHEINKMESNINIFGLDVLAILATKEMLYGKDSTSKFNLLRPISDDIKEDMRSSLYTNIINLYLDKKYMILSMKKYDFYVKDNRLKYELIFLVLNDDNKEEEIQFNYDKLLG